MKNFFPTLIFLFVLLAGNLRAQTMPLYLNFNSHNEVNDHIQYANGSVWLQYRGLILAVADTFNQHGVKWNLQVDSDFILADLTNESGFSNPNDLLDSLDNSATVEVDPHNHFDNNSSSMSYNPYNYPDLAHLLDSAGLQSPRKNMGGFIWTTTPDFMPYQNPVAGNTYPDYTWRPDVIWGAGSPNHQNDYNGYGVWKPQGPNLNFFNHDPSKHLTFIGNGCSYVVFDTTQVSTIVNAIVEMLQYIQYQPYDPMAMYTASIQMNFRDLAGPGYVDTIAAIVRGLEPYVNSGQIVYQTLSDKYTTWYTAHSNTADYFRTDCQGLPLGANETEIQSGISFYPNPSSGILNIQTAGKTMNEIQLMDMQGKLVLSKNSTSSNEQIDLSAFEPGMYFAIIRFEDGSQSSSRIIRE